MAELKIVDAHHHFWDLSQDQHPWLCNEWTPVMRYGEYAALRRNYLPADFFRDTQNQNVVMSVHVEAECRRDDPVAESRWLSDVRDACGFPTAAVGQAWFARSDIDAVLAGHAEFPFVRSIRQKPVAAARPDQVDPGGTGSMGDPKWRQGYALLRDYGLSYDLQTPWWHLAEAADLAAAFPDTTIILNHTGLPADRDEEGLAGWRAAMRRLAGEDNVCVKISGIGQFDKSWPVDGNRAVVRETIEIFGVERCMFASNYPVDGLCADYDTIFDNFKAYVAHLPAADQGKLFHDNAVRYYRLDG